MESNRLKVRITCTLISILIRYRYRTEAVDTRFVRKAEAFLARYHGVIKQVHTVQSGQRILEFV